MTTRPPEWPLAPVTTTTKDEVQRAKFIGDDSTDRRAIFTAKMIVRGFDAHSRPLGDKRVSSAIGGSGPR